MASFEFLGPYRIGKPLGRGGMGSVYAAVHERTGERVAVKLIAQDVSDEPRFRRRFDAEIESLQRLSHPGIVRPLAFGEEDGHLFYSMELVEGESLQARIRREKRIDWRPTLDIAIQICAALKHAHDIGVIHRDLKPANLMLTKNETVKLVDFGIAKVFGYGDQTLAGSVLGTADYMAPEQATSAGTTARTDLYGLGNVMYAMLTGRPPFTGKKITEVIESLKRDRPVPLDLVNPELPDALVELVHQLLEKDPRDRPPTALAVMNRLKAMRAGLQREQTVVADGSATEVGFVDPESHDTSASGLHDSDSVTDAGDRAAVPRKKTVVSKGGPGQHANIDRQAATVVSDASGGKTMRSDGSVPDDDKEAERVHKKTHFQTVSDATPTTGMFQGAAPEAASRWTHWLSIAGMVGILMVGGALFIIALRPPSADDLYDLVVSADDVGAAKTFIRRFPNDPRYEEVFNWWMDFRLRAVLKRLETQANLKIKPLEPTEEGFIGVMTGREQEPAAAMKQIQEWRTFYDNPSNELDPDIKELIELARHEEKQLELRAPEIIIDPRAERLISDIRQIVEQESIEDARRMLRAFPNVHQTHDWARPAIDEAKRQLELLDESPEPSEAGTSVSSAPESSATPVE